MPYRYISSMMGEIPPEVYYLLDEEDYDEYLDKYAEATGVRRTIVPAILKVEYSMPGEFKGRHVYRFLESFGFAESTSISVMKLFMANDSVVGVVSRLVDMGYDIDYILYGMDYRRRLHKLGIESISIRPSFAFDADLKINPIKEIYVAPPPEFEVWRPFQISMLIDCTTRKEWREEKRKIEFRGIFSAKKHDILADWWGDRTDITEDKLGSAAIAAEDIIKDYASIKGYEDLIICSNVEFFGMNLLESEPDIIIDIDEVEIYESSAELEVIDIDYGRIPFTDRVIYVGEWWKSRNYYITELRKQVETAFRWG